MWDPTQLLLFSHTAPVSLIRAPLLGSLHFLRLQNPGATIENDIAMEEVGETSDVEREAIDSETQLLRDRFRLSAISIAESEAKKCGMGISETVVACITDLAFKYTGQLAKDLELFAQHANRKSVNMEDVILSAHRNEHLSTLLRTFSNDLKAKEPQSERKRKKSAKKDDKATT